MRHVGSFVLSLGGELTFLLLRWNLLRGQKPHIYLRSMNLKLILALFL